VWRGVLALGVVVALPLQVARAQQSVPSPSQVAPPDLRPAPLAPTRILLPRVEAGGAIPEAAKKLSFVLQGLDIEGEFDELAAARHELESALIGKGITVAQLFEFGTALQAIYVRAGYPLVRIVITPQELDKAARVKMRVVDGFVEQIDAEAIAPSVRKRVLAVLGGLLRKPHLTQNELERKLLIAGEAPGLELNAVFAGGKEIGGSILVLTGRYKPVFASIYGDNAMPKVFGTWQAVTSASLNSVLGLGEQFSVSAAGYPDADVTTAFPTRRYLSASVLLPLGIDGWKLELSGTQGRTTPRVDPVFATQGLLTQGRVRLAYSAIKRRDSELTFSARFDSTDEEVDSLLFSPVLPLSLDRVRALRAGLDGVWQLRETGTVIGYGATLSRGLDVFGARTAAAAAAQQAQDFFAPPLSRLGADAVFSKLDGRFDITQSLPQDFFLMLAASGQTGFNNPLLKSEQFDIVGARMVSGYSSGSFAGDRAWVTRLELGRNVSWANQALPTVFTPYLFGATGERILEMPTVLERASMHASNLGAGLRVNVLSFNTFPASFSGFVEGSRQHSDDITQSGWRIFAGASLRY
jgi:hemolysin activation/secretion protein